MKNRLSRIIISWALGGMFALSSSVLAQVADENAVKAAFVYNFIVFTEWPAHELKEGETIDLCINAYSPMAPALSFSDGKQVRKHRLRLRQLNSLAAMPASCRIVFLDPLDRQAWPQIRRRIGNASVLTISDDSEINEKGPIIALYSYSERIVFDIDMTAAKKAELTMSSKLLKLARTLR